MKKKKTIFLNSRTRRYRNFFFFFYDDILIDVNEQDTYLHVIVLCPLRCRQLEGGHDRPFQVQRGRSILDGRANFRAHFTVAVGKQYRIPFHVRVTVRLPGEEKKPNIFSLVLK